MAAESDALSRAELECLLAIGNGDAALLMIYARLKGRGAVMPGWSEERLRSARMLLRDAGLLAQGDSGAAAGGRPSYPASEMQNPAFTDLARETERILGKPLSSQDLQILYGMYEWRGLPPDVLHLLIHYCRAQTERRCGPGSRPSLRQIDREAGVLAEQSLYTHGQAEDYIRRKEELQEKRAQVFRHLGFDHPLSNTEKKYVNEWIALGFDEETIGLAYDITVTKLRKMSWPYCNKIILNWHEKGWHTAGEVEAGDAKPAARRPSAPPPVRGGIGHTREVLRKIKR